MPCVLSMHDDGFDFRSIYKDKREEIFSQIDCWRFRSYPIKRHFESYFGKVDKAFMYFSGVPEQYICGSQERSFDKIDKFLFVGLLLKRKHPFELVQALCMSNIKDFTL